MTLCSFVLLVSIHTPTWGVTVFFYFFNGRYRFQSTHLHEVWLRVLHLRYMFLYVSIHTPTWGVTFCSHPSCDHFIVSIHTPTWGVTWLHNNRTGIGMFQSTHLHEVWRAPILKWTNVLLFQSTHLHEVWLFLHSYGYYTICFNPHTYMRCD